MAQVSVMPAKTRPAPTKPLRRRSQGVDGVGEDHAGEDEEAGGDTDLALEGDHARGAADGGEVGGEPGVGAAFDDDGEAAAGGEEFLAGLFGAPAGLAEDVEGVRRRARCERVRTDAGSRVSSGTRRAPAAWAPAYSAGGADVEELAGVAGGDAGGEFSRG